MAKTGSLHPLHIAAHGPDLNVAGIVPTRGGIHKDHALTPADGLGQFRAQLLQALELDLVGWELPLQQFGRAPRKTVIGAQWIPVSDNKDARHIGSL